MIEDRLELTITVLAREARVPTTVASQRAYFGSPERATDSESQRAIPARVHSRGPSTSAANARAASRTESRLSGIRRSVL